MTLNKFLRAPAAALAALMLGTAAWADVPQQKTQAPGYYRLMLGAFEVTALSDGTFPMDTGKLLIHIEPAQLDAVLAHSFLRNPVEASVNAFLINTGSKLVLIDTGAGSLFGPTVGKLMDNLKASGYRPDQVDEIYITHMHSDHVGGLSADGKRLFANALVRASQPETDFWLSKANMEQASADRKDGFKNAMNMLNPYVSAGKFKPFSGAAELVSGIRAVPAPGHTPGHTLYMVESDGQKLLLWGDLMHVAAVQFPDPSVAIRFDSDSPTAIAERKKVFAEAAAKGFWVGGAHLSFPGIGHLRSAGAGYDFVPVNYGAVH